MGKLFIRFIPMPVDYRGVIATNQHGNYFVFVNAILNSEEVDKEIRREMMHIGKEHFKRDIGVLQAEAEIH